jgi:quercetin dioxygenase-like cupin family protein
VVANSIHRKPLLSATMNQRAISSVDVRQITFVPNQQTGRHRHPCPVVGYIAWGTAVFQIEGQPAQELSEGEAFYEPADTVILRFDNASSTDSLTFIACYLLDGQHELIHML